jgi:hypothetical protein
MLFEDVELERVDATFCAIAGRHRGSRCDRSAAGICFPKCGFKPV